MLWQIGLLWAGVLCLLYYGAICIRLKRWDSTFSRVWLFAGLLFFVLRGVLLRRPNLAERSVWNFFWIPVGAFVLVECLIASGMLPQKERECACIIVLGAQVNGTRITDSLRRRLDRALTYLRTYPNTKVIVSGGQGKGELITEAQAMADYLQKNGIAGERLFLEGQSGTTKENLEFSKKYVPDASGPVGIISNNFHMYRACGYAKRLGYHDIQRLPAGCHPLLFPNYMVRECFAVLKFWLTLFT